MASSSTRRGRRPTGRRGEFVSEYQQVTVRLPPETVKILLTLSIRERRPQWKIVTDAIESYAKGRT